MEEKYKTSIHIFEHGNDIECKRVLCTVEHAHMHFLPANVDIYKIIKTSFSWEETSINLHCLREQTQGREYLYYENYGKTPIISRANEDGFESQ